MLKAVNALFRVLMSPIDAALMNKSRGLVSPPSFNKCLVYTLIDLR